MIVEKVPEEIVMNLFSTRYFDSVRKKTEEIARKMGFDDEQIFDSGIVRFSTYGRYRSKQRLWQHICKRAANGTERRRL